MSGILEVPNTQKNVTTLALATEPCDTLALLIEIKAISPPDLQRVTETKTFLQEAYRKLTKERPVTRETDDRLLIWGLQVFLHSGDNQAYLAYQLKLELSPRSLIDGLTDLLFSSSGKHRCRPWAIKPAIRNQTSFDTEQEKVWLAGNMTLTCQLFLCQLVPSYFPNNKNVFHDYIKEQKASSAHSA